MARKCKRLTAPEREALKFIGGYVDPGLNNTQLARALRCSRSTVRYWKRKGDEEAEAERTAWCR